MVIIDFNAKVGHHKRGDGDAIDGHGLGIQSDAGERLVKAGERLVMETT